MKIKLLFILLLQIFVLSSYAQTITQPQRANVISSAAVVNPPPGCDDCPLGYQWNKDFDKDGFGDPAQVLFAQTKPNGYVANQQDCNDNDATINPNTIWYRDADGDGYGTTTTRLVQCLQPTGYIRNSSDLDDSNPNIINVPAHTYYRDFDGDGFGNPAQPISSSSQPSGYVADQQDCNDADVNTNPNTIWYRDLDADGYGLSSIYVASCTQPSGYVKNTLDYDDNTADITNIAPQFFYRDADGDSWGSDPAVYRSVKPDGYVTNRLDYDDTTIYINNIAPQTFYADADLDGYGNPAVSVYYSIKPFNWQTNNSDCNDADATINPNTFWNIDADGDGYGNGNSRIRSCTQPAGYVRNETDCNDADASLNPATVWYLDADGDGYGNNAVTVNSCTQPTGYVRNNADCNDSSAGITPNLVWYADTDGDGYGNAGLTTTSCSQPSGYVSNNVDCNDADISINPNTVWYRDADVDGYGNNAITTNSCTQPSGYVRNNADYDDATANITNIAPGNFYRDVDQDTFGNPSVSVYYSVMPAGYVTNNADYDDTTVNITNIAPTNFYRDADQDTFGNPSVSVYYSIIPAGYVTNNSDYDDTTVNITNIAPQIFYQDADGDTFGNPSVSVYYSVIPAGYVANNTDCNDAEASLNPNTKWYADNDMDGLGDPLNFVQQCLVPNGNYVRDNTDNCPLISGSNPDCSSLAVPSLDQNYIITKTYKQPTSSIIEIPAVDQVQTNITYFDGLGRPMQQIANKQSPSGKDIITHIGYDEFGRQLKEYLPYEALSGNMKFAENAEQSTTSFYATDKYENTSNPFSEKQLESSPLNRVLKQAAPGTSWAMNSGHEIKLDYQTNSGAEVKLYAATAIWNADFGLYETAFSDAGNYDTNELLKSITYDENTAGNPTESAGSTVEFKNKEGQVVLKRTYESSIQHDTYYVYDNYGNLTYVIPPKADAVITATVLNDLCYQYKYDYRNRLVEKKLPGKQWEFIVYDKLDRPVATGPANSPFSDISTTGWLITKYDAFSRPVYTGWNNQIATSATRKSLQDAQNTAAVLFESKQTSGTIDGVSVNYSNTIEPTSFKLLTVSYYDDYSYPSAPVIPGSVEGDPVLINTKGMVTGNWARVLTTSSAVLSETTTTFYDIKARPIRTYLQNHLGGYTYADSKIDFIGKPLYTIAKHKRTAGDTELTTKEVFTYSAQDRLLTHTHQINGGVIETIVNNTYDELGQLTSKKVGNNVQNVNYTYNVRGWLKDINNVDALNQNGDPVDLFAFKINYNNPTSGITDVKPLYNGNISETYWATNSDAGIVRSYSYKYDNLNRLKDAFFKKGTIQTDAFNESLSYDKNGNIMGLTRNGSSETATQIDNLEYNYGTGNLTNQLTKVIDSSNKSLGFIDSASNALDDYSYDTNGNMTKDNNKNITSIVYNHLNLPTKITFATTGNIIYIYNASGQKIQKIVNETGLPAITTDYLGGYQYNNSTLKFFPTAEGYVEPSGSSYKYVYQYKDHLGNIRLNYDKNLVIQEENNYYPFGLKQEGYNNVKNGVENKYKYQEQERQDELGLNWDSFKWRNYDFALGRFMSIDPLAEKYPYNSTYAFQENKMGLGRELEGLELVSRDPTSGFGNYVTNKVSSAVNSVVNFVTEHVVLQVEAKATIGVQAGVKTPFGSVGAGIITADIGKVGINNTDGAYAKKGDGKGHNFIEASAKVGENKETSVGFKVDYVNNTILPNGNGNGTNGNTDLLQASSYQGKTEWEVNIGPSKRGPGFADGALGDISTPSVKNKATLGSKSDCTTCVETSFGAKAIIGVEVKVKAGYKK